MNRVHRSRFSYFCVAAAFAVAAVSLSCQKGTDSERGEKRSASAPRTPSDLAQPGAEPFDTQLAARLRAEVERRGPDYQPRTRHLHSGGAPRYVNRLLFESSPYLQQHAHNPVNWYPWGEEAFADARRLGRMILLSVGYSTCHWCHVMEEESFEDVDIARYLNANYIAIKVDREELPDVDSIYMAAVIRSIRRGGWPMTVWLTPEREPIYGATYLPPRTGVRGRQAGFLEMLQRFKQEYDNDPQTLITRSQVLVREIAQMKTPPAGGAVDRSRIGALMRAVAAAYARDFDPQHGGRSGSPKFPSSFPVRLILRLHRRTGDPNLLNMAVVTLEKMAGGGIYDHVGGGFHRYSVDARWLVPHFEKMLYDNALLTLAYLDGYQVTGRADFADVARDILRYISREMTAPRGGFYSATDADSKDAAGHMEEGAFFVWTLSEMAKILDGPALALAKMAFAVTPAGNFEGKSILHRPLPMDQVAASVQMTPEAAARVLIDIKARLYEVRANRSPPLRDEKVLVAWNGLMISAFARASTILPGEEAGGYLARARAAADFILTEMQNGRGLWRSYRDGDAHVPAYLDDYAFFINGLIDVFEASGEVSYLERAIALDRFLSDNFEDRRAGGFFLSSRAHDRLLTSEKPLRDGAVPSGNSVAAQYLLRLYELTSDVSYLQRAEKTIGALASILFQNPLSLSELLLAVDFWSDTAKQVVIIEGTGGEGDAGVSAFAEVLGKTFVPNAVVTMTSERASAGKLGQIVPIVRKKIAQRGHTTAYVCEEQVCELPTRDPAVFARQIGKVVPLASAGQ